MIECRNGKGSGFFIPEPNPRVKTHGPNPARLLNEFFLGTQTRLIRPHGPRLAQPDLGPIRGLNHGPIEKKKEKKERK